MSAPHSNADDSEPPPTVSISPGPLGSSRSNAGSPILSNRAVSPPLSTPASASFRLGATSQEISGTGGQQGIPKVWSRSDIDEEYTWSASMKEGELNIPDLTMLSTPPETSFSKWEMDLLRSLVGKLPYLIDDSCERLIDSATSKLERRGNRMLYSAVWDMIVEKSKTSSQAKMFKNDSKALLGDGLGLVHELKEFTAFGNEEANVAASQFGKLTLGASDPVTVDQFLSDLEDGWARAGALVNTVTAISLIDDQFKNVAKAEEKQKLSDGYGAQFVQVIELARLGNMWDARAVINAIRSKTRMLRMQKNMQEGLPGTTNARGASRRAPQLSVVAVTDQCRLHPNANHTNAECRLQQQPQQSAQSSPDRPPPQFDPALPKNTCNSYFIHGNCRRGDKCKFNHDKTKAASSTQAAACMPDLIDLDGPSETRTPVVTSSNSVAQLAQLPPDQLAAIMNAYVQARSPPAKQLAIKRQRAVAEDRPEREVRVEAPRDVDAVAPQPDAQPLPAAAAPAAHGAQDVDDVTARLEQLRIAAEADKNKPKCGAPTKSGKPCERTVAAPGQLCRDHDPSLLKCDGKTTLNKPCGKTAVDGLTKCAAHAKQFIEDGGDPNVLKRADGGNAAALQAGMQAMQTLAKDDRVVGDTGATNHTARPADVVASAARYDGVRDERWPHPGVPRSSARSFRERSAARRGVEWPTLCIHRQANPEEHYRTSSSPFHDGRR